MNATNLAAIASLQNLTSDKVLATPVSDLTLSEQVALHVALKAFAEASEARLAVLKENLSIIVNAKGTVEGKNGTKQLPVDGSKVTVQQKTASNPTVDGLVALLKAKNIPQEDAIDEVKTAIVNPSKVAFLLSTGKLTQEEVDALRPVTPALKIYPSKLLKAAVQALRSLAGKGKSEEE